MTARPSRRPRLSRASVATRRQPRFRLTFEVLEDRCLLAAGFIQVNLVSDVPGLATSTSPFMVNPWGISFSPTGAFWFAENGAGASDLADGDGAIVPLVVEVPAAGSGIGSPTGTVFYPGSGFLVSDGTNAAPGQFLFASEDGLITGWSPEVDWTRALVAVDNSDVGASYKGLAIASDDHGKFFIYAADFQRGQIDVFDEDFRPVRRPGAFVDPTIPEGFAPFNVHEIGGRLFVTYARQDDARLHDSPGAGDGFINVFDVHGSFVGRFASAGPLNSPWGLTVAPASFGALGGALLVGNAGDGLIHAYRMVDGAFLDVIADRHGQAIVLPRLWALAFGNGHDGGDADTLFFTAGLEGEAHGLFGAIQAPQRRGDDTGGAGEFDPTAPGERPDYPLPPVGGPALVPGSDRRPGATLLPATKAALILAPTLSFAEGSSPRSSAFATNGAFVPVAFHPAAADGTPVGDAPAHAPAASDGSTGNSRILFRALSSFLDIPAAKDVHETAHVPTRDAVTPAVVRHTVTEERAPDALELVSYPSAGEIMLAAELATSLTATSVLEQPTAVLASSGTFAMIGDFTPVVTEASRLDSLSWKQALKNVLICAGIVAVGSYGEWRRRVRAERSREGTGPGRLGATLDPVG